MVLNLCIDRCMPPVGSVLFIGCGVANTTVVKVLKPLLPMFVAMLVALILITYIPALRLALPKWLGF